MNNIQELTEEYILATGYFGKTEIQDTPSLFNGDNIMLAIREYKNHKYFDAFLHCEVDGKVFFAVTLRTVDEFRNFYLGIEKIDIYEGK